MKPDQTASNGVKPPEHILDQEQATSQQSAWAQEQENRRLKRRTDRLGTSLDEQIPGALLQSLCRLQAWRAGALAARAR